MDEKQIEALITDPSVLNEVLGSYDGPYSFGVSRYPDQGVEGELCLFVDTYNVSGFPKFIKRHGNTIVIKISPGFKDPQAFGLIK